jgi:hypothetical protein
MIDQLISRAEADLERAAKRHEIAQALAADWTYWAPLLVGAGKAPNGAPIPVWPAVPVLEAPEAQQSACKQCGNPFTPNSSGKGRPQVYCSSSCRLAHYRQQSRTEPEPLPDQVEGRPFVMNDDEPGYVRELLRPAPMPWETP